MIWATPGLYHTTCNDSFGWKHQVARPRIKITLYNTRNLVNHVKQSRNDHSGEGEKGVQYGIHWVAILVGPNREVTVWKSRKNKVSYRAEGFTHKSIE